MARPTWPAPSTRICMTRAYGARGGSNRVPPRRHHTRAMRPSTTLGVDVSGALNLVGALVKYLGAEFVFPAAVAAGYGEAVWPFVLAGVLTVAFGVALERATSGKETVGAREGYLVVSLLWLLVAVFGAVPYVLAEPQLSNPVDALFESMSGFSTTGSSVIVQVDELSRSMAMWRQFTTW